MKNSRLHQHNGKQIGSIFLAAALLLALPAARVEAISLTPASIQLIGTTTYNSVIDTPQEWLQYFGITPTPFLVYKSDQDPTSLTGLGKDDGAYATSYQTTFSNTLAEPSDALIHYLSGSSIICGTCYLIVKGGNTNPAQYLFSLTNWNGTEDIVLSQFWPGEKQGAISNVAIYANTIPEPAVLSLVAAGLVGVGVTRRRQRRT